MSDRPSRRDFLQAIAVAGASCSVRALVLSSVEAATYLEQGRAQFRQGQLEAAIISLTRAIEIDPTDEEALDTRSVVFEVVGDHERAMADRTEIIRLNPSPHNFLMRGIYALGHDPVLAVADFSEVMRQPQNGSAHEFRGIVYEEIGRFDMALADYASAQRSNSRWRYRKCFDSPVTANCRSLDEGFCVSVIRLPGQVTAFPLELTPGRTSWLPFSGDVQSIRQAMDLSRCALGD